MNPPQAVVFREGSTKDEKAESQLEIVNKNKGEFILFKVKTTDPANYIVRPNQGVIAPEASITVKITCQQNVKEVLKN